MEKLDKLHKIILNKPLDDVINFIKTNNININSYTTLFNSNGSFPLGYAAHFAKYDVCKWLLENGADINQTDANGRNALFDSFNDIKILKLFLKHGIEFSNIFEQIEKYEENVVNNYTRFTSPRAVKRHSDMVNHMIKIKGILLYEYRKRKLERITNES